ncbi:MAG: GrpE protein [Pseudonocardiales bacterium]|nr:GrpE protein [Pseudonocardiales bacterium]
MTERPEGTDRPDEPDRVVVRDKRRIDPVTGAARTPAPADTGSRPSTPSTPSTPSAPSTPDEGAADVAAEVAALRDDVAERTADLQRVQAEYANYRKRAERDRLAAGEVAISRVLTEMLPVLDDIDRARQHGDLTGALKAVADHLDSIFSKLGLQAFGEVGDPFDPAIHEAVLHTESDDVSEPTCTTVMRQGYRHGERLLRPAMVGVSEPATPTDDADPNVVDEP